jgi:two-component system response regulator GlrR
VSEERKPREPLDTMRGLTPFTDVDAERLLTTQEEARDTPASGPADAPAAPAASHPRSRRHTIENLPAQSSPPRDPPDASQAVRRFRLSVVASAGAALPAPGTPAATAAALAPSYDSASDHCSIGSHLLNDLVLDDPTVSGFHCEIRVDAEGAQIIDLRSRNGTIVDGVKIREAYLRGGSTLRLGRVVLRFEYAAEQNRLPVSTATRFGSLVGHSVAMRMTFALLERAAASDATILLEGETGTGKGRAAEALHRASARASRPFVVVDCSAIPGNLLESELFGHEKGSFTGADARRIGAFEEAAGGTIFLDEIGELPSDLQPKLLRVLENREIRRVGSNRFVATDVRVIAATNRDLREEVNAQRFRSDLYFRLAVVKIAMPCLRERAEDIPELVDEVLASLSAAPAARTALKSPAFLADLARGAWPGNVRELRNHVERCLVLQDGGALPAAPRTQAAPEPYGQARAQSLAEFERRYLEHLLEHFGGRVADAARCAGVDRVYLYRLMRKHGLKAERGDRGE